MTLEPRMLAVEERLQRLASAMPAPDADAGWAALSAKLGRPMAQVIPLRRKSFMRPVLMGVAAALLVAGSAFAAVTHGGSAHVAPVAPAGSPAEFPGSAFGGPHLHVPLAGPSMPTSATDKPSHGGTGDAPSSGGTSSTGSTSGDGSGDGTPAKPKDDPNDRDQGTGNDGQHNDHGGGNNGPEGSQPRTSDGGNAGGNGQGH